MDTEQREVPQQEDSSIPLKPDQSLPAKTRSIHARMIALFTFLLIAVIAALMLRPSEGGKKPVAHARLPRIVHQLSSPVIPPPACPTLGADPSFGVSLIDTKTGQPLCERNPDGIAQPASTTKIMSVLLTAQYLQTRRLSLDTHITAQEVDTQVEGDAAVAYLQVGQSYSVRVLLYMVSMLSAADATMALARFVAGSRPAFLALMNAEARSLGMQHTHYTSPYGYARTSPNGWQQGEQTSVGNYSCAHDMALLTRALAQYPAVVQIFGATSYHEGGTWLSRANGFIITDSWIGLSTATGVPAKNLHLPFQVLAVKKGCMWCEEYLHKLSYVMLVRYQQQAVAASFLYTTQNYGNPRVGDILATLLWAFNLCNQSSYATYCQ